MRAQGESPRASLAGVFEVMLWGYDRGQVDRCMGELEERLTALYDDQRRAIELDAEVKRCQAEIADLRARLCGTPVVHQVGTEVADILSAAERQAVEIRSGADRELAAARDDAVRIVAAAKQHAAQARRDCDVVLREHRRRQQELADQLVGDARAEAERIVADARARAAAVEPGPDRRYAPAAHSSSAHTPPPDRQRSRSATHDSPRPSVQALGEEPA